MRRGGGGRQVFILQSVTFLRGASVSSWSAFQLYSPRLVPIGVKLALISERQTLTSQTVTLWIISFTKMAIKSKKNTKKTAFSHCKAFKYKPTIWHEHRPRTAAGWASVRVRHVSTAWTNTMTGLTSPVSSWVNVLAGEPVWTYCS